MTEIQKMIEKKGGENGIPSGYLRAIAEVESKASSFAVNAYGRSHNFKNKEEAVEFIKSARRRGARNISIGCMQLHVSHANRFKSIEDFVEPINNISFAAQYLASLHKKYGSWEKAIMRYHSAKASYGKRYLNKVMKVYNRGRS
jgi:soluble lytic murein transglycosylase-like protein